MALHCGIFKKMFLVASSAFLVQYFVYFITTWGPQDADLVKPLILAVHLHISTYWQEKRCSMYAMWYRLRSSWKISIIQLGLIYVKRSGFVVT